MRGGVSPPPPPRIQPPRYPTHVPDNTPLFVDAAVSPGSPTIRTFTWRIPPGLDVRRGSALALPWRDAVTLGIALRVTRETEVANPRDALAVLRPNPLLSREQIALAEWIAERYLAPLFSALALFLPPHTRPHPFTPTVSEEGQPASLLPPAPATPQILTLADPAALDALPASRPSRPANLLERLAEGPVETAEARRILGGKDALERWLAQTSLAHLTNALTSDAAEDEAAMVQAVQAAIPPAEARAAARALRRTAAERRQLALLRLLAEGDQEARSAKRATGATPADLKTLQTQGWISFSPIPAEMPPQKSFSPIPAEMPPQKSFSPIPAEMPPQKSFSPILGEMSPQKSFSPILGEMSRSDRGGPPQPPHAGSSAPESPPYAGGLSAQQTGGSVRRPEHSTPPPPTLTPNQQHAADAIRAAMADARHARLQPRRDDALARSFLLHGVTGSGKTEVYLNAADDALAHGESVIALVPEIALAPQTVARFEARFPGRVAVRHSALRPAAAREQWRQLWTGERRIVVGPRSALFAPLRNLGLIILDEEHEWTYKQSEPHPRYHARDAAEHLAARSDAVLLLGSATPDITTMWRAQSGTHHLLELPTRVESPPYAGGLSAQQTGGSAAPPPETPLPDVEIIDLRDELRRGNRSVFSRALSDALTAALNAGEQALLFLNRRGLAAYVCRACGAAVECAACQLPLTLHRAGPVLQCHECGRRERAAAACPVCGDERLRPMSFGLQRIEDELRAQFGDVPISRWDRDSLRAAGGHAAILDEFASGRSRVLIGTQMIAKGLDVPAVTVAGVLNADLSLRMPDYTAPERTFQLLTQVAGRAGRGGAPGRVIIQTYSPDHYAVQSAAAHDYAGFYAAEMRLRAPLDYPPYGRLARILCSARTVAAADELAETVRDRLTRAAAASIEPPPEIIGPSEPWPARLRGRWRRQIVLRGPDPAPLLRAIKLPRGCTVEIDPTSLL